MMMMTVAVAMIMTMTTKIMVIHLQIVRLTSQQCDALTCTTPVGTGLPPGGSEHSTGTVPPQ
jgi:hypothetical protein